MSLIRSLATLFALPLLIQAAPAPQSGAAELATAAPMYYLKTANASCEADHFNNLYVEARPISTRSPSTTSEVVLTANKTSASRGYLNSTIQATGPYYDVGGSYQQFDLTPGVPFQWGFAVNIAFDRFHYWQPMYIQLGSPSQGFFMSETGLQSNISGFGGWLACDWSLAQPQLFYINEHVLYGVDYSPAILPGNCVTVNLVPEYV